MPNHEKIKEIVEWVKDASCGSLSEQDANTLREKINTLMTHKNTRSGQQNNALHLYFSLLAKDLNDKGLDMKAVMKPTVDIDWETHTVKKYLWKPIQELVMGEESTTKLQGKDIDKIYDTLNRHFANTPKLNSISIPFPSDEHFRS